VSTTNPISCTVLVLNYNGLAFLKSFCTTWKEHLPSYAELVIADNASTDESLAYLATAHPEIRIIKLEENHGFAKGYNIAMQQIKTTYSILLNSDIEIKSKWIEPLVDLLEADEDIAAVQPKILDQKKPSHFEYAGAAGGYLDKL